MKHVHRGRLWLRRTLLGLAGLISACGVVYWAGGLSRTSQLYRGLAEDYGRRAESHRRQVEVYRIEAEFERDALDNSRDFARTEEDQQEIERLAQSVRHRLAWVRFEELQADHFEMLRVKYEVSAKYPWQPVAPDPPGPRPPG